MGILIKTTVNRAAFFTSIFLILSGILGFAAQVTYLSIFKASYGMGLFYTILSHTSVISGIAPVVITATIIPYLAGLRNSESEKIKAASELLIIILFVATVISLIGFSYTSWYINSNIVALGIKKIANQLSLLLWISSCIQLLSLHFGALLQSERRFFTVTLSAILTPLFGILLAYFLGDQFGVISIAYAYFLSALLQIIILFYASRHWISLTCIRGPLCAWICPTFKSVSLIIVSLLPFTLITPFAYFWANELPEGAAASFGFNASFSAFVSVAVSMGMSTVLLPEYSDSARSDEAGFIRLMITDVASKISLVLMLSIMIGCGIALVSDDFLKSIFMHSGRREQHVQNLIPWFMLSAVAISGLNILRSFFYAIGYVKIFSVVGIISIIIFNMICWFFGGAYGIHGIVFAFSLTFVMFFLACLVCIGVQYPEISISSIVREAIAALLSGLISTAVVYITLDYRDHSFKIFEIIVSLLVYGVLFILVHRYIFVSHSLKRFQQSFFED